LIQVNIDRPARGMLMGGKEPPMKLNIGDTERVLRIVVGLLLLAAVLLAEGGARWLGLVGIVPLLTGAFGYCPLYAVLRFNTCPIGEDLSAMR
jgi:hypothetical protein